MIPRRGSRSWLFPGILFLLIVAGSGGVLFWRNAGAPGVGFPDSSIRPFLARTVTEAPSREHFHGSIHDSIRPMPEDTKPVHAILVYVHGISCHSPDYSAPFQFRLAKALGLSREVPPSGGAPTVSIVDLTESGPKPKAVVDYLSTDDFDAWRAEATPADVKTHYLNMKHSKAAPPEFAPACSDPETGALVRPLEHPRLSIRHFSASKGERLSVVEVLWSPLSERQKLTKVGEDLNLDASSLRAAPPWPVDRPVPRADVEHRALANQMLKSSVINGAIADAIFYLGDGGPSVRAAVMAGLSQAIALRKESAAAGRHQTRITVVTESLGSRIAFDTMREAPDRFASELDDTLALLKSTPRIVMFANQLPLLDIAKQPDRSIVNGPSFQDAVARHSTRAAILRAEGDRDAGTDTYRYISSKDPPSWRACGEAFSYYVAAADSLAKSRLRNRIVGASASGLADNMEYALTHPLEPVLALFEGADEPAQVRQALDVAKSFAGNAMGFLGFSPGGMGYANCQLKVSQERARLDAHYLSTASKAAPGPADPIGRIERLLKIAQDVRAAKIADIDAISNSRASMVFGLLYKELDYLIGACATAEARLTVCSAAAVKKRLARVAALVPRIEVLAFSDPNDLLSYRVTAEQYQSETFNFINVPIRLADPIVPAAGRWGGFTPPMEAHTNHKFDNRILSILVCGWDDAVKRSPATINGQPCPLQLAPVAP